MKKLDFLKLALVDKMQNILKCMICNNISSLTIKKPNKGFGIPKYCDECREIIREFHHGPRNQKLINQYKYEQRLTALAVYSENTFKCKYCGYDNIDALCLDHINNDGNIHRKKMNGTRLEQYLERYDYKKNMQVLCHNCNHLKRIGELIGSGK